VLRLVLVDLPRSTKEAPALRWLAIIARSLTVLVASGALTACTVHLVSDYDDQIDTGLSQLNTDITAFVNKMIANAGQPAGAYDANKDFYTNEEAKADTLIVRAQAHKVLNNCPSSDLIKAAVKSAFPPTAPTAAAIPMPDVSTVMAQIQKDDCSVVLLGLVKQGIEQLATFHTAQGSLGIPAQAHDPILVGGLGSVIHAAITVEVAKKTGGSVGGGGKNGS
jgi:hypothetical protein